MAITGMNKATPATKHVAMLFEHLGFTILDEIHVPGEFHGNLDYSAKGRLGDVLGRPNENDLAPASGYFGFLEGQDTSSCEFVDCVTDQLDF